MSGQFSMRAVSPFWSADVDLWTKLSPHVRQVYDPFVCIVGGTGGLGLLTATWLAHKSAQGLILVGRSGRLAKPESLGVFRSLDCLVSLQAGDTSLKESASALLQGAASQQLPLAGVMHAAGIQV